MPAFRPQPFAVRLMGTGNLLDGGVADRRVSAAIASGELDNLPGRGKPLQNLGASVSQRLMKTLQSHGQETSFTFPCQGTLNKIRIQEVQV